MKSFILNLFTRLMNAAGSVVNPATEDTLSLIRTRLEEINNKTERIRIVLGDNLTNYTQALSNRDIKRTLEDAEMYLSAMWHLGMSKSHYTLIDTVIPSNGSYIGSWVDTVDWGYKVVCLVYSAEYIVTVHVDLSPNASSIYPRGFYAEGFDGIGCQTIPARYFRIRAHNQNNFSVRFILSYKLHVA